MWFSEGLKGVLIPLFPYLVVLLLSQHKHTDMAQPQFADGMLKKPNLLYLLISNDLKNKGLLQEAGIIWNRSLEDPYGGDVHQKLMN